MLTAADAEEWRQWCADHPEAIADEDDPRSEALKNVERDVVVEGPEFKVWRE